ncbi:MAG TPA: STAS/SEC14 domain-containing protein [Geopsychrobacteraceae bacterium]|nr:STAS/SEC14 domain-containing protein [Geopsychrobacteraceae bacterium]
MVYRITRPLTQEKIYQITIELEWTIETNGKIRALIDLQGFPYPNLETLWDELNLDVKHINNIEYLALVSSCEFEKWSTRIFSIFTLTNYRCSK